MLFFLNIVLIVTKLIIIAIGVFAAFTIGKDAFHNLTMLSNSSVSNFKGISLPVNAVVSECLKGTATLKSRAFAKTNREQPVLMKENSISLIYEVDGINYIKKISFVDVHNDLNPGDVVELLYDSAKPCNAVMADGSDAASAKNGLKWDAAMAFIALVIGTIVFLRMSR